jgi:hypothetical protein
MPLSLYNRFLIAYILARGWSDSHQENPRNNNEQPDVLVPVCKTFSENNKRRNGFEYSRYPVPHAIHENNIRLFETDYEEVYDPDISSETTEKIAQLVASCKELQMKVAEYFGDRQDYQIEGETF